MCATKLASDHVHHNVTAAAFACGSCWDVQFQRLEIGMSVSFVESEYVVRCTSRVSWNRKSRDDDRFSDSFCASNGILCDMFVCRLPFL